MSHSHSDAPGIFNDILGPVMRGPSSSHTAGSFHIATLVRALAGGAVARAQLTFDPDGSYARVYRQQGVDRAFAMGLLGWPLTDGRFMTVLDQAPDAGLDLCFTVAPLSGADHPNTVEIVVATGDGRALRLRAKSVGGGAVVITRVGDWPVRLTGQMPCTLVEVEVGSAERAGAILGGDGVAVERVESQPAAEAAARSSRFVLLIRHDALPEAMRTAVLGVEGVCGLREAPPTAFAKRGRPLFSSAAEMVGLAETRGWSLGRTALAYEAQLLELPEDRLVAEMRQRFEIMRAAVNQGLSPTAAPMQLLAPTARHVMEADQGGRLPVGGLHARAAARAMAVMHVNGAMGVVCAAPTGGSAGVLPGVLVSLVEDRRVTLEAAAYALFAASAVGLIVAARATFAAEVAGCQVEIGAAGAMAAAAVVETAGGTPRQAADAAAIAFQNTMGSVCDLVQGVVEIPCHTRNAVGASSAFVCADLIVGGYQNPIGLDETIDAVYDVGRMMPPELRCTARGGLAITPSALSLHRRP
ncbi:MAG TPA: L-serine ammonia-lyase, iron-sulfur-dependent, subunit alpha [Vicinamibacterales bacterium]|jgi:L-serine dehydratase